MSKRLIRPVVRSRHWIAAALFTITAMPSIAAAPPAWRPDRAVEIIATNAPGGGGDRILRIMANVMQEQRALDVPFNVINKPGGGGAVSFAYLNQHPGDGRYLLLASKSLLTNHIVGRGPSYTEFTSVALLFGEWIAVTVKPDSPLKSGRDLVERLKKDPAALSFGIATSIGNPNHQGVATALKAAGIDVKKLRAAIFPSGGAAITAMLGGHIDVVPIMRRYGRGTTFSGSWKSTATSPSSRKRSIGWSGDPSPRSF
jgi:putative tricarboxylic transport membrane protein